MTLSFHQWCNSQRECRRPVFTWHSSPSSSVVTLAVAADTDIIGHAHRWSEERRSSVWKKKKISARLFTHCFMLSVMTHLVQAFEKIYYQSTTVADLRRFFSQPLTSVCLWQHTLNRGFFPPLLSRICIHFLGSLYNFLGSRAPRLIHGGRLWTLSALFGETWSTTSAWSVRIPKLQLRFHTFSFWYKRTPVLPNSARPD